MLEIENSPSDICHLPKDRGPCDQYKIRYYYVKELQTCKYFFYGGCDGNQNNFESVEECRTKCLGNIPITSGNFLPHF